MTHFIIEIPVNIIVMASISITHRAWIIDLRCMSAFFLQSKEILFVPAVDEGCFKDLLFSGILNIFDCMSSLSFISMILSTVGLLH